MRETRKLATILSLDVAGYSRAAERDESAAADAVRALRSAITEIVTPFGGRIFNSAGDGFMLEFPSAASGVQAAMALLRESKSGARALPKTRIGLHLGDVIVEDGGDLLGHGVNVAARLQALADSGSAIVSETVRSQIRSTDLSFRPQGRVQLDKMSERIAVYALSPNRASPFGRILRRRALRGLIVLAAIAGSLLAALMVWRSRSIEPDRIAVAAFETLGSSVVGVDTAIVDSMAVSDLSVERVAPGAPAAGLSAAFLVEGAVREQGDAILVEVRIIQRPAGLVIWSSQYRRPAAEADAIADQVAAHVTDVLRCALISRRPRTGRIAPEALSIFLRACDRAGNVATDASAAYEAARRVTQLSPSFSRGWSLLAVASAQSAASNGGDQAQALIEESAQAATRALELDPHNSEAYLARFFLLPMRGAFHEQRRIIDQALEAEPNSADVWAAQGSFQVSIGRVEDGLASFRRAAALDPLSADIWAAMIPTLAAAGEIPEAKLLRDRLARVWPNSTSAWWNRLNSALYWAEPDDGLRMLDEAEAGPIPNLVETRDAWRPFLLARQSGDDAGLRMAARHIAELALQGQFNMTQASSAAFSAGEADVGYELVDRFFDGDPQATDTGWMFFRPNRALLADPRFMTLAHKTDLVAYWSETGQWPDFCSTQQIPYDCRASAQSAMEAAAGR